MRGHVSLVYQYRETINSSSHHRNDDIIYDYEILRMYEGDVICGYRFLETRQYSSLNRGVYHIGYLSGDDGRGGYISQEIIQSYSKNPVVRVYVDWRGGYRSQTSHSLSNNTGGHGRFLGLSFYSCPVDENFHGDKIVGYSIHDNERGDTSGDDVDERGDISRYDVIHGYRSQETSHYYFNNNGESVDGDGRGGYRSQTRHYYSHNAVECGRLLCLSVASHQFQENVHGNKRDNSSGDDRRRGFRSQETSQSSFQNRGESVDCDVRYPEHQKGYLMYVPSTRKVISS